jgi:hypothetical protein
MECEYCNKTFSTKPNLLAHQKSAKFCLKLQGKESVNGFKCDYCEKTFTQKINLEKHECVEKYKKFIESLKEKNLKLKEKNKKLEAENYILKSKLENKETNKKKLAIDKLEPITQDEIQDSVYNLKTCHVTKDEDGFAKFLFDNFCKDKVILSDSIRNKFIYKQIINEKQVVVHDDNLKFLMKEIFTTIQYRISTLINEYIENWYRINLETHGDPDEKFNYEDKLRDYEKQIYKITNGSETEFEQKIIKALKRLKSIKSNIAIKN